MGSPDQSDTTPLPPDAPVPSAADSMVALLWAAIEADASDVHLCIREHARLRVNGALTPPVREAVLCAEEMDALLTLCCAQADPMDMSRREAAVGRLGQVGVFDGGFEYGNRRWRAHFYRSMGSTAAVLRLIQERVTPLAKLGLPPAFLQLLKRESGIILVCGATGAGKSTTLTAAVDNYNHTESLTIQMAEAPIEYRHVSDKCVIRQCEVDPVGDIPTFKDAATAMLRRDPDVVVLGEMRDQATIEQAMRLAGSGHLVFSTMHTSTASGTVEQILQSFPEADKEFFRTMLAQVLVGVLAQVLVPTIAGKRTAAYELLINDTAVANLIVSAKPSLLRSHMLSARTQGMQTRDQHLYNLVVDSRQITKETALEWAVDPIELAKRITPVPKKP